ncbi:hypothetical protein THAOC_33679, partial [Thalassiosira oceanica]
RGGGPAEPSAGVQQHPKRFVLHGELVRDDAVRHLRLRAVASAADLGPVGRGYETRHRPGVVPQLDEVAVEPGGAGAGRLEGDREAVDGGRTRRGRLSGLSTLLFRRLSLDVDPLPRRGIGRRQREGFDARPPVREEEGSPQQEQQRNGRGMTTMSHPCILLMKDPRGAVAQFVAGLQALPVRDCALVNCGNSGMEPILLVDPGKQQLSIFIVVVSVFFSPQQLL